MGGAELLEALIDDAVSEFRAVAFPAQMAQIQLPQVRAHYLFDAIGGGFVGEMAVTAKDALLQCPRTMWAFLEHFDVVVGFEDEHVRGAEAVDDEFGDMAEIGGESDIGAVCAH